jgi:hypothetical protein
VKRLSKCLCSSDLSRARWSTENMRSLFSRNSSRLIS